MESYVDMFGWGGISGEYLIQATSISPPSSLVLESFASRITSRSLCYLLKDFFSTLALATCRLQNTTYHCRDYKQLPVHNLNSMLWQTNKKLDLDTTGSLVILNEGIEV